MAVFRAVRSDLIGQLADMVTIENAALSEGFVDVEVALSSLSRSDALTATGVPSPAYRPVVPGCGLVGTVVASRHRRWTKGDVVFAIGHGLGLTHDGGWAERTHLSGNWLTTIPDGLTPAEAIAVGTPGLAAMLATIAIEDHGVPPESGPIVVTGATGGVGSLAVIALSAFGYDVVAVTRRLALAGYLRSLGATEAITLSSMDVLTPERWSSAVDTLGGPYVAALIAATRKRGVVVSVGTISGERSELPLDLLGQQSLTLVGLNATEGGRSRISDAWARWAEVLNYPHMRQRLAGVVSMAPLEHAVAESQALLAGERRGRIVIQLSIPYQPSANHPNGRAY